MKDLLVKVACVEGRLEKTLTLDDNGCMVRICHRLALPKGVTVDRGHRLFCKEILFDLEAIEFIEASGRIGIYITGEYVGSASDLLDWPNTEVPDWPGFKEG